jgi:hypothetical protein
MNVHVQLLLQSAKILVCKKKMSQHF